MGPSPGHGTSEIGTHAPPPAPGDAPRDGEAAGTGGAAPRGRERVFSSWRKKSVPAQLVRKVPEAAIMADEHIWEGNTAL